MHLPRSKFSSRPDLQHSERGLPASIYFGSTRSNRSDPSTMLEHILNYKMQLHVASYLILFATILSYHHISRVAAHPHNLVKEACDNGLDFSSINDFRKFIGEFKLKSANQLRDEHVGSKCITERESILELEGLVTNESVCDYIKIDEMINFHKRYLTSNRQLFGHSRPMVSKFFTKYAIQVAYVCKKNLISNLEIARQELRDRSKVFEEARDKLFRDEPSVKSNIKLIEEQPDSPSATIVQPQDQAELTLSEYREALTKLQRPEDILTFDRDDCIGKKNHETIVAKEKAPIFFKPALVCLELSRYYAGSLLSIARLANYGYMAVDEDLDSKFKESQFIKDWIVAVQVCDPMLFMATSRIEGEWTYVDTCSKRVQSIEMMVYDDNFDDFDNDLLAEMIPKSEATRQHAQKLMRSAMKKMTKINIMLQLSSGVKKRSIFSKSLSILTNQSPTLATSDPKQSATGGFTSALRSFSDVASVSIQTQEELSDEESYNLLKNMSSNQHKDNGDPNSRDGAVGVFDPISSLVSTITVVAIMLSFEWLFFIVMTLAARICHSLHFEFDNLLTFPPKILSWSDADFASFNDKLEQLDEDDLLDYDELNPDEKEQRDLLAKVFGRPPPMLYKD